MYFCLDPDFDFACNHCLASACKCLPLFTIMQMFVLCVCMHLCMCLLPLSAALWPYHHEGLPVLSREPGGEVVQASLHVWSLNNRQCVRMRELFQCETLGTLECIGC